MPCQRSPWPISSGVYACIHDGLYELTHSCTITFTPRAPSPATKAVRFPR
nr:hypothetical protein [Candidatus Sigynarchaeum springense]